MQDGEFSKKIKNKLNLKVNNLIYLFLALFVLVAFFIFETFFTGFFATTLFGFDTFAFFIFEIFFTGFFAATLFGFDTFAFFIFEIFFTGFFAATLFGFAFLASLGFAIVANIFCLSSHHEDFFDVAGFTILLFAINFTSYSL